MKISDVLNFIESPVKGTVGVIRSVFGIKDEPPKPQTPTEALTQSTEVTDKVVSDLASARAYASVEAASADKYVSRARVSWLWVMLILFTADGVLSLRNHGELNIHHWAMMGVLTTFFFGLREAGKAIVSIGSDVVRAYEHKYGGKK
jgi:hypothetical protein